MIMPCPTTWNMYVSDQRIYMLMSTMTLVLMEALYHQLGEELVIATGFSSRMECTTTTTLAHMEMLANTLERDAIIVLYCRVGNTTAAGIHSRAVSK